MIWSVGREPSLNERLNQLIDEERDEGCFLPQQKDGMSLPAASQLQERMVQNRQLKRANRHAVTSLWISGSALIISISVGICSFFK